MEKTRVPNPKVRCGTCRFFDGTTWCRHWNFFTQSDSPPCRFYRAAPPKAGLRGAPEPPPSPRA